MTNKFDLKKYLTEHKATQASILREGFEEKLNERPITEEENEKGNLNDYENRKEYDNYGDFIKGIKTEYPDITNKNLIVKDSPKFPGQKLYNFDDPFGPNRLIAIWNEKAGTGIVKPNTPEKESPYISPDPKNLPKGMYGESKEALKAKIKEMIIAELSLAEENDVVAGDYNFVAEGSDDEDYEKSSREVEFGVNPDKEEFDLKDFFMDDEKSVPEIPMFKGTKNALDDLKIKEAKKKKDDAPEEELDLDLGEETPKGEEDVNIDFSQEAPASEDNFNIDTSAVDPNIKAVQDA